MDNYLPINVYTKVIQGVNSYDPALLAIPSSLAGMSTISGNITDVSTGALVSNLQISFREGINNHVGPVVATAVTDFNRNYTLQLPVENYTGEISGTNYITDYANLSCANGSTVPGNIYVSP